VLSNVRFSFCQEAVRFEQSFQTSGATVSHAQFVNCVKGIVLTGSGGSSGTAVPLTVHNGLMAGVQYPLTANTYVSGNLLYHCTIDQSTTMITATASSDFTFVNSVFANITTLKSGSTTKVRRLALPNLFRPARRRPTRSRPGITGTTI